MDRNGHARQRVAAGGGIGIALGGGGARGFAHVGVITAMLELGVPIRYVAGTSIGAIVGGLFASGGIEKAIQWADAPNWSKLPRLFFEPRLSKKALIRGDRIEKVLHELIPVKTFGALDMPFAAVATDLATGESVSLEEGDLHSAIRASMAIPGVFSPVWRDGRTLVDGALVNPLPVDVCRKLGADKVLAVDLNGPGGTPPAKPFSQLNLLDVLEGAFRIFSAEVTRRTLAAQPPDVLLQPAVGDVHMLDFRGVRRLIGIGYDLVHSRRESILSRLA